jgi:hypothetical protein
MIHINLLCVQLCLLALTSATSPAIPINRNMQAYRPKLRSTSHSTPPVMHDSPPHVQRTTALRNALGLLSDLIGEVEDLSTSLGVHVAYSRGVRDLDHDGFSYLIKTKFDGILDSLIEEHTIHEEVAESEKNIFEDIRLPHSARKYEGIPIGLVIHRLRGLRNDLSSRIIEAEMSDDSDESVANEDGTDGTATEPTSDEDLQYQFDP